MFHKSARLVVVRLRFIVDRLRHNQFANLHEFSWRLVELYWIDGDEIAAVELARGLYDLDIDLSGPYEDLIVEFSVTQDETTVSKLASHLAEERSLKAEHQMVLVALLFHHDAISVERAAMLLEGLNPLRQLGTTSLSEALSELEGVVWQVNEDAKDNFLEVGADSLLADALGRVVTQLSPPRSRTVNFVEFQPRNSRSVSKSGISVCVSDISPFARCFVQTIRLPAAI